MVDSFHWGPRCTADRPLPRGFVHTRHKGEKAMHHMIRTCAELSHRVRLLLALVAPVIAYGAEVCVHPCRQIPPRMLRTENRGWLHRSNLDACQWWGPITPLQ
jgi:hypothetical protein